MMIQPMPNIIDWTPAEKLKVLVFAPSKTGKTFGAATFPRPNFIDCDKGIATLRNPEFTAKHGLRSVEYEQFSERNLNSRGVPTQHNAFDDACKYFDKCMKADFRDRFDTWVIDSGTTLSEMAMNKAIVLLGSKAMKMSSATHEQAINTGLVYPKQQDYGSERSM
ncbi:MAG: AAA family ATPase, partial [Acidimicrobiales bacterium]